MTISSEKWTHLFSEYFLDPTNSKIMYKKIYDFPINTGGHLQIAGKCRCPDVTNIQKVYFISYWLRVTINS